MKKIYFKSILGLSFISTTVLAQTNQRLIEMAQDKAFDKNKMHFVKLKENYNIYESSAEAFLNSVVLNNESMSVKKQKSETDDLGYTHTRYQVHYNNIPVQNAMIITHAINGKVASVNGDLNAIQKPANSVVIKEASALQKALAKVNAKKYKWENKEEENHMREALNNPNFSYIPKGELVLYPVADKIHFAYKFNIYAEQPLYKANVYVDAQNGKILGEENQICHADVPATANTKYSGVRSFTVDNVAPSSYRLRETGRGNGIRTYNLNNGSNYGAATDFTNSTTSWTTTGVDQAATDAHWGAEMTYDYFMNNHGRNSIDGAGYNLLSYVHYNTNYNNAFWDGIRMTYGDGNGTTFTILTALDVCGHEIAHGLTSNTSALIYSNESGALNESYSDIFGNSIENFARPSQWSWRVGEDMTPSGNGIRNMANPNQFSDPDTYLGTHWYTGTADNGGVHTNSGVSNYWYYLLVNGGAGVNDISNSFTVNAIGWTAASRVAFRALTVYYTPSTNYAQARNLSIQAAKDLYGSCSNEVVQVTNAWYAVGVGPAYSNSIIPNFNASSTSFCSLPASINFNNITANGITYEWNFGDGSAVSTSTNPSHTYTNNGTYSVKLKATGCLASVDSITKVSYVTISTPPSPTTTGATRCGSGSVNLSATGSSQLYWYPTSTPTGSPLYVGTNYSTPTLTSNTTYYVVNTATNAPIYGAPTNTAIGAGANFTTPNAYDVFDVFQPCTLKTVVVYASTAGNRTIELRNSSNAVITSSVINIPVGMSTVTLNFALSNGTGYRLGLNAASAVNLYRNSTGASFPYNIGGLVNITGTSAGSNTYFYFFYNWQVQKANCESAPIAVTATINPGPNLSVNSATICSGQSTNLTASGATTYSWSSGQTTSNISVSPLSNTNYTVYGTTASCTNSLVSSVMVNPSPTVTVNSATICAGQTAILIASGASLYSWSSGPTSSSIAVSPSVTTSYTVLGLTGSCTGSSISNVMVNSLPTVSAVASKTFACLSDGLVNLTGTPSGGTFSGTGVTGNNFNPATGTGTYAVTYVYTAPTTCSNSTSFNIVVDVCASVQEAPSLIPNIVNVYPNPVTDYFIVYNTITSNPVTVRVFDTQGKLILNKDMLNFKESVDVSKLSKGTYFVEIINDNNRIYNTKIIKQ